MGEASDYFYGELGIYSSCLEMGDDNPETMNFFLFDVQAISDAMKKNYPLVYMSIKEVSPYISIELMD